ncbi:MAG: two-component sensor histidine kinase [Moraxella sp.]|jgi:two-component system, NtrC family, sensor histidine kinase PilS|nr:ATP-binding protein [Moraxella osloensis]MBP6340729.1 two-component sensor histidine kinase [Moraxella sp.]MBP6484819.1 two-component sensor histidine kinase [Moraxella sp.]MBP7233526.1 two-component sensor histidine kinase [Moraxella sp.]
MITNPAFSSLFDKPSTHDKTKKIGNVYNGYRIIIAIFFSFSFMLALKTAQHDYWVLINLFPTFFYFFFSITLFILYYFYPKNPLLMVGLTVDALVLTTLLYFSGGNDLQVILLFLVQVAAAFMLVRSNQAILLTIFAITLVIYQQFYQTLKSDVNYALVNNVASMAISFIGVAYLSYTLSKRLKQIERLSERQVNEVNALNAINNKIVQIIDQGVVVLSHDLEIFIANDTAIDQLHLPKTLDNFNLPDISPLLAARLAPVIEQPEATLIVRLDVPTTRTPLAVGIEPNNQSFNDLRLRITQLRQQYAIIFIEDLRHELSRAQQLKLASLGQLSASIAHEIRNPLATISQASQLLMEEVNEADSGLSDDNILLYEMIYHQTIRVNKIIEDVLKLSRQQRPNFVYIEPKTWLNDFIQENFSGHDIFLHCHTDKGFMFDNHQLAQILVNLINNGLRFSSKTQPHAFVTLEVYEFGKSIHIDVIDTGHGVAKENIEYLFNPFFTTDNQGTGLGLYLSQAFCQANYANLEYVPSERQTCFRIICQTKTSPSV